MPPRCRMNSTSSSVDAPGLRTPGGDDLAQLESRLLLQHCFQVVRVIVLAVDEDDLLGAAGDVVLALVHEREIAGPHPAVRADRGGRSLGIAVVTAGDVVALDQEVPDHARCHLGARIVHQPDARVRNRAADAHQPERIAVLRRGGRKRPGRTPSDRRSTVSVAKLGSGLGNRHGERCLREAVDRQHRRAPQTVRRQAGEELLGELHRDRLGAVEDDPHAAQVDAVERLVAERAQEMPVAEVRRAGHRHSLVRYELHPEQRAPHEQIGRHQVLPHARVHHEQVKADQPHVVRERHPAERGVGLAEGRALHRAVAVREDVRVGQHHALGSLVEPDENCMNAVSSGRTRAGAPSRDTSSSSSIRNVRRSSADHTVDSPISGGKGGQPLAELPRRVEQRVVRADARS